MSQKIYLIEHHTVGQNEDSSTEGTPTLVVGDDWCDA